MDKKLNIPALAVTAVVLIAAIGTILYASAAGKFDKPVEAEWYPDETYRAELTDAVKTLLSNNYQVYRLYEQFPLSTKAAPYGKVPEDGAYLVIDETYTSMAQIEDLVNSTYVQSEAERILNDYNGTGPIYIDKEGALYMVTGRAAQNLGDKSWKNIQFEATEENMQPEKAILDITLDKASFVMSPNEAGEMAYVEELSGGSATLQATVVKEDGVWKLESLIS